MFKRLDSEVVKYYCRAVSELMYKLYYSHINFDSRVYMYVIFFPVGTSRSPSERNT